MTPSLWHELNRFQCARRHRRPPLPFRHHQARLAPLRGRRPARLHCANREGRSVKVDTNLVALLMQLMAQKQAVPPTDSHTLLLIVGMLITAVAPTLASIAGYFKASAAVTLAQATDKKADDNMALTEKTAESTKAIHIAVNSERSLMQAQLKEMNDRLGKLAGEHATLVEQYRTLSEAKQAALVEARTALALAASSNAVAIARREGAQSEKDKTGTNPT